MKKQSSEFSRLKKLISELEQSASEIEGRVKNLEGEILKIEKELKDSERIFTFDESRMLRNKIQITFDFMDKIQSYCRKYQTKFNAIIKMLPLLKVKIELSKGKNIMITNEGLTLFVNEKQILFSMNELPNSEKGLFKKIHDLEREYLRPH